MNDSAKCARQLTQREARNGPPLGLIDGSLPEQRLNQWACRQRAIPALLDDLLEDLFHALQVGDLCAHVLKVGRRNCASVCAGLVALVYKPQQRADFIK
ncbi:hypothetical protein X759_12685 [Mesorhizobium sp. LSHC420B00]|nr:hypothetical protein X759_12685 [Mesorhizobium sp. LSHC420B00]